MIRQQTIPQTIIQSRKDIFLAFTKYLNGQDIPYIIVGSNTSELPEIPDNDIDFVISVEAFRSIDRHIREFCTETGIHLVQMLQHESVAKYFVVQTMVGNELVACKLDICSDYVRDAKLFIRSTDLLEGRQAIKASGSGDLFFVAAPRKEFIYYFLKKVDKCSIDTGQFEHLREAWLQDRAGCQDELKPYFSASVYGLILSMFIHPAPGELSALLPMLRENLHQHISSGFWLKLRDLRLKFRRLRYPTGLSVAFFGPDGAGKTTIIDEVLKAHPSFRYTARFHLSPKLLRNRAHSAAEVTDPHSQPPRSAGMSTLKILFLLFEYSLGWLKKVWPLLVRSHLVVFDRYYHDLLVDPRRYRHGGGLGFARLVGKLIPRPTLFFLLDAPAEVLQARKQEVTLEESRRARDQYLKELKDRPHTFVIDASRDVESIVADIQGQIMLHLTKRMSRRGKS